MTPTLPQILALADAGTRVADIASRLDLSISSVYATLRTHRPNRPRSRRQRTSQVRLRILALAKVSPPNRVAKLMAGMVSRQYVYKVLQERG